MDQVREEIDRLDTQLIALLAERWQFIGRASQLKASPDEAVVPWRIEEVVKNVREHAESLGIPGGLAEDLWRRIIDWSIQHEEHVLKNKSS